MSVEEGDTCIIPDLSSASAPLSSSYEEEENFKKKKRGNKQGKRAEAIHVITRGVHWSKKYEMKS
jgi:hypothetical protein